MILIIGLMVFAYAYASGKQPSVVGHSAEELDLSTGVNTNAVFNENVNIFGLTSIMGKAFFNNNVGIGVSNPTTAKLVINASGGQGLDLSSSNSIANMRIIKNTNSQDREVHIQEGAGLASKLFLYSNNALTMTLTNGNVGIGTSVPTAKLDVNGKVIAQNIGTTYTRWGRSDCDNGAELVYDGYIASHFYRAKDNSFEGGGGSQLCLVKDPSWLNYSDADENGNLLYGTEYETGSYGVITLRNLHDKEAPCAVCLVKDATINLMVPGKITCPTNWKLQYAGYLMSTHYTHSSTETICVDQNATATTSSNPANQDGNLLYPTEAECGALTCPADKSGYVQNREVTCSVCTR